MVTYDYGCEHCKVIREERHSIKEDPEILCRCGRKMERVITQVPQVLFKDSKEDGPWTWKKKSISWFNSGERERQRDLSKREKVEKEKSFYTK